MNWLLFCVCLCVNEEREKGISCERDKNKKVVAHSVDLKGLLLHRMNFSLFVTIVFLAG